ncbi:glycosyltransferase [Planococcus rifietoensis]|uniref:glycosyltransferase n=1 Tax=Planococcus rifietoensis TaxID=200991 RepID=UPI003218A6C7
MNILYISNLKGTKYSGPHTSVPAQIKAQSKYDNVYWFNINESINEDYWGGELEFHNSASNPLLKIDKFPPPFNKPDLVIFQGLYYIQYCNIGKELKKYKIPYIIIPRGALTKAAQKNKKLKKSTANSLFFNKFIKNALAIHYLTEQELIDSSEKWNNRNFVMPNGHIVKKLIRNNSFADNYLKGVFIGRPDVYQKGLDLFLNALGDLKERLLESNCLIEIYGPEILSGKEKIQKLIQINNLEEIVVQKGPVYDEEKENVLLNSDYFILTSRFEGHPMGLIEALGYGLPCFVTSGSNMSNEIFEENAGWTADISVESIKENFAKLLDEKEKMNEKGGNAVKLAKKYDWNIIAQKSRLVYLSLLEEVS